MGPLNAGVFRDMIGKHEKAEVVSLPDRLLFPGQILSLTAQTADRLVAAGSGDAALLYLFLLRRGGALEVSAAVRALKWPPGRVEAAFDALAGLGLADRAAVSAPPPRPEPAEPPEYTAADLTRELEDKSSPFPALVGEVQRRLGKLLSTADLKMLYLLYDYLALPAEVIMLLVSWCVEEMESKYGPGRKPKLSQIRKEGFAWHRHGIDTTEAAEAHLKKLSALRKRTGAILPLLGIRDRAPVEAERRYIAAWVEMGFEDEAIRLAYERTVLQKQSMNWPYMNSILKSWHQKGLHTVAAVQAGDSSRPQGSVSNAPRPMPAPPGEADRRVREDLARMRAALREGRQLQQKGEE